MKLTKVGVLVATAVFAFAACSGTGGSGGSKGDIDIWSSLPRQGSSKAQTDTIVNAIKMAIEETAARSAATRSTTRTSDDSDRRRPASGTRRRKQRTPTRRSNDKTDGLHRHVQLGRGQAVDPDPVRQGIAMISPANTYPGLTKPGKGEAGRAGQVLPGRLRTTTPASSPLTTSRARPGANWAEARRDQGLRPR